MAVHTIKKGLDIPISGEPEQVIHEGKAVTRVALVADDYIGMKPTMHVAEGDKVKRGQLLFENKKEPGVLYTSPGAGEVVAVNRGEKRALLTVVVELNSRELSGKTTKRDLETFESYSGNDPAGLSRDEVVDLLVESGMWPCIRTRPMSKAPDPKSTPSSIFITATDTNPLSPVVDVVYEGNEDAFAIGLQCIAKLREGRIYLCRAPGSNVSAEYHSGVTIEEFEGVHPSGTVGLHIHTLEGVNREHIAWHINYQDVIAVGNLFTTGQLDVDRVVSLAGPSVSEPRLIRTRVGASTEELTDGELLEDDVRVISGSVLSGRKAMGEELGFLGRFHHQISVIHEDTEREFLGWLGAGIEKYSLTNLYISSLNRLKRFAFSTSTNGSPRPMVPIGMYERVMPMDIIPSHLLRYLIVGDLEKAEELGCLELDEEDLALCTFVCPGKYEYGPYLRRVLTEIEQEG